MKYTELKYRIHSNGTKEYLNDKNEHHREDGHAIELANGDKEWYQNGKFHRVDGPAVEWANGDKAWYQNGKFHREDGPAIEYANGGKEYWINGQRLTEQEFLSHNNRSLNFDGLIVKIKGVDYLLNVKENGKTN